MKLDPFGLPDAGLQNSMIPPDTAFGTCSAGGDSPASRHDHGGRQRLCAICFCGHPACLGHVRTPGHEGAPTPSQFWNGPCASFMQNSAAVKHLSSLLTCPGIPSAIISIQSDGEQLLNFLRFSAGFLPQKIEHNFDERRDMGC